jgi:hypothetical protein
MRIDVGGWGRLLAGATLISLLGACSSSGRHPAQPPLSSTSAPTTATTVPAVQTSGVRTVLSPVGLNMRAQPNKSAKILGTAAQGTVLTVLGHTDSSGGWFDVKGASLTGWISGDPTLSAPGEFRRYTSGQFNVLYPATWTSSASSPASVTFQSTGPESIISASTATRSQLPQGRAGYGQKASEQVVVCGVTSYLVTYQSAGATGSTVPGAGTPTALPYLAQVRLTLDAQHALGFDANLTDLEAQLLVFHQFLASVTFPFPPCTG